MIFTVKDAKEFLADFVDESGVCPDDPRFLKRLDEAQMLLIDKGNWKHTLKRARFCMSGGCLVLPPTIDTVLAVDIDKYPANVWSQWYEFLDSGPGEVGEGMQCVCSPKLVDRGYTPLFRQLSCPRNIMVVCEAEESGQVQLKGLDATGREVMVNGLGEFIDLNRSAPNYSVTVFSKIEQVIFPTKRVGYVHLYEYDPVTKNMRRIGVYGPNEMQPYYRQYIFTGGACCESTVTTLCKSAYYPMLNDSDPLIIQHLIALKFALIAVKFYNSSNPDTARKYVNEATAILNEQLQASRPPGQPEINISHDGGLGLGRMRRVI